MIDYDGLARDLGYSDEKEMWNSLYTFEGMSLKELDKYLGVASTSIRNRLAYHGIKIRSNKMGCKPMRPHYGGKKSVYQVFKDLGYEKTSQMTAEDLAFLCEREPCSIRICAKKYGFTYKQLKPGRKRGSK